MNFHNKLRLTDYLKNMANDFRRIAEAEDALGINDQDLEFAWDEVSGLVQELEMYAKCMDKDVSRSHVGVWVGYGSREGNESTEL